jgi:hypothetical protein
MKLWSETLETRLEQNTAFKPSRADQIRAGHISLCYAPLQGETCPVCPGAGVRLYISLPVRSGRQKESSLPSYYNSERNIAQKANSNRHRPKGIGRAESALCPFSRPANDAAGQPTTETRWRRSDGGPGEEESCFLRRGRRRAQHER